MLYRLRQLHNQFEKIFNALDRGNLLPNGILPAGTEFDSLRYVSRLVEGAKSEIVLVDPYSDAVTLEVLSKKASGVKVRLYCKDRGSRRLLKLRSSIGNTRISQSRTLTNFTTAS